MGPQARKRRRTGVIIAASVLAHAVVLSLIGFSAPKLLLRGLPPEPAIQVWLTPALTPETHIPKVRPAVVARTPVRPLPISRPARPAAAPTPILAPAPPARSQPAPSAPAVPAAGAPIGRSSAPATVEGGGGSAEEALRTSVGCDYEHMAHLSPTERDRCSQSISAMARRAPAFNGIDPAKRARFDEQVAADERRRAARTGSLGQPIGSCEGAQSNLGGGCLPDSAIGHWKIPSPNN